jgi:magnesium chelatase family protein
VGLLKENIPEAIGFIGALSLDRTVLPVEGMIAAVLVIKKLKLKSYIFHMTEPFRI